MNLRQLLKNALVKFNDFSTPGRIIQVAIIFVMIVIVLFASGLLKINKPATGSQLETPQLQYQVCGEAQVNGNNLQTDVVVFRLENAICIESSVVDKVTDRVGGGIQCWAVEDSPFTCTTPTTN